MNETIEQQIFAIIGNHCGEGAAPVQPTSSLSDLGIDSLEAIEIIFDIEEHFNVTLPDRNPDFDTGTVQGLVHAVEAVLAGKAAAASTLALPGSTA